MSLTNVMKEKKVTTEQLAKMSGINKRTLDNYRNGHREMSLETGLRIAKLLEVSPYRLLDNKGEERMKIDKDMIASRANAAAGEKRFFKSHIKNAYEVESRDVSELWQGSDIAVYERDWVFSYKEKTYRVNESRRESFNGTYTLEEVDG